LACFYLVSVLTAASQLVTKKRSLLAAFSQGILPSLLADVPSGGVVSAFVRRVDPALGVFLELAGELCGLAPAPAFPVVVGQSVRAHVKSVDLARGRISFSLSHPSCFPRDAAFLAGLFAEEEEMAAGETQGEEKKQKVR
jgi:hypothetical protein